MAKKRRKWSGTPSFRRTFGKQRNEGEGSSRWNAISVRNYKKAGYSSAVAKRRTRAGYYMTKAGKAFKGRKRR